MSLLHACLCWRGKWRLRRHLWQGGSTERVILTAFLLGKSVQRVVTLAKLSDKAGQRKDSGLSWDHASVGVDVSDSNLDGSMVLGLDDSAGGSTFAWDVKVNKISLSYMVEIKSVRLLRQLSGLAASTASATTAATVNHPGRSHAVVVKAD